MKIVELNWTDTILIRHTVLWPNEQPEFCKVEGDEHALHFGIEIDEKLVCVASIFRDGDSVRLRKFATLVEHQGKGVGSYMLRHLISEMRHKGMTYFWFDARETALNFYERFGFKVTGDRFYKHSVPYYKMHMHL